MWMNENYGPTFRVVRKSQDLTLKEVAEGITSLSFLGKFETGKTSITLPLLLKLLERINFNISEFVIFCDESADNYKIFSLIVTDSYHGRDILQLESLKKREERLFSLTNKKVHQLNSIMISAMIVEIEPNYHISQDNLNYISTYLLEVPFWSDYNLFLLENSHVVISPYLLGTLMSDITNKREGVKLKQSNPRALLSVCHRVSMTFLRNNYLEQAIQTWTYAKDLLHAHYFFEKNQHLFIKGLISIHKGQIYEGITMANDAISTVKLLENQLANVYVTELESTLERVRQVKAKEISLPIVSRETN